MIRSRPTPALAVCPAAPPAGLADRDDDALMSLAAGDHRPAFEVLASRYLGRLASYGAKFLGDPRAGEEVAQEVLLEVWVGRRRYRPQGRFAVFLFRLARSRCLNRMRDDGRRPLLHAAPAGDRPGGEREGEGDERPGQLDVLLEQERARRVREALVHLTPKLREAVLLRFDQGLDYAEIAKVVRRSEVTTRSRVFHGLKKLRALLAEEDDT
jgi:RNA polymerase sigma-70 factor, ECF subfamily